jgi:hypothetical protein
MKVLLERGFVEERLGLVAGEEKRVFVRSGRIVERFEALNAEMADYRVRFRWWTAKGPLMIKGSAPGKGVVGREKGVEVQDTRFGPQSRKATSRSRKSEPRPPRIEESKSPVSSDAVTPTQTGRLTQKAPQDYQDGASDASAGQAVVDEDEEVYEQLAVRLGSRPEAVRKMCETDVEKQDLPVSTIEYARMMLSEYA